MNRDPFDTLRSRNPAPPKSLPEAPMAVASRIAAGRPSLRRGLAIATAAAAVVLVAGGGWLLWSQTGGREMVVEPTTSTWASETTATVAVPLEEAPTAVVYFLAEDFRGDPALVPVARDLNVLNVRPLPNLGPFTMELLLWGPGAWDAGPLPDPVAAAEARITTAIPEGTELLELTVADGVATVGLSVEFAGAPAEAVGQVVFTLTRLEGVGGVTFLIEGVPHSAVAGMMTLVPTASPPEGAILEDPATRLTFEGLMPLAMLESPALGGTLQVPGTITGGANPYGWRVGLSLEDDDGTVLWETVVQAACGTPWQACRGEYDWSIFQAAVPAGLVDYGRWGTLTAYVFSGDDPPQPYAFREQPVWLQPVVPSTDEPEIPEATTTSTSAATTTVLLAAGAAPWSAPPLPASIVPEALVEAWTASENRDSCPALYPEGVPQLSPGAEAFVHEGAGWWFAWDLPSGPGYGPPEGPIPWCTDCGHEAFGVGGAGVASGDEYARWPAQIMWDDGSRAGYGYSGDEAPDSGAPLLAYIVIPGRGCLYGVWSFLGEDHFLDLIERLRFVEGMGA
ncbi:MAG: GerMN domain-containing protein [Actinomycetota bacterium]